ncbi:hypothetical protein KEM52_006038, partial [Ascosphaera acerosa]
MAYLLAEKHFSVVRVFEQRSDVGGVWNPSSLAEKERLRVPVPQVNPHDHDGTAAERGLPAPDAFVSPLYRDLEANIPKEIMGFADLPFPADCQVFPRHQDVRDYLTRYAEDVEHLIQFNTEVIAVVVDDPANHTWLVTCKDVPSGAVHTSKYDAVVVANGHFATPYIPRVPGITAWHEAYPGVITHAKQYMRPEQYADCKVLIVGNSASGIDISAQVSQVCQLPILLSATSKSDLPSRTVRQVTHPIIKAFLNPDVYDRAVIFEDGHIEEHLDAVIYCTGYLYSLPFLRDLAPPLITDGARVHGLYEHLFSIEYPTLALLTLPQRIVPLPVAENQSAVLSRVWSGRLTLPPRDEMIAWESGQTIRNGDGKAFHLLPFPADMQYLNRMYSWAASASSRPGLAQSGQGKLGTHWGAEQSWIRERIALMRDAFAKLGDGRRAVHSLPELGFDWPRDAASETSTTMAPQSILIFVARPEQLCVIGQPADGPIRGGQFEPPELETNDLDAVLTVNPSNLIRHSSPELAGSVLHQAPGFAAASDQGDTAATTIAAGAPAAIAAADDAVKQTQYDIELGELEFALPLSLDARLRHEYDGIIEANGNTMLRYLTLTSPEWEDWDSSALQDQTSRVTRRMVSLLDRLLRFCTHADLSRPAPPARRSDVAMEAQWAKYCSAKYDFLQRLCAEAGASDLHCIIYSRPGRSLQQLRDYLCGLEFVKRSALGAQPGQEEAFVKAGLSFSLRSTADEAPIAPYQPPDAIIAWDATLQTDMPSVRSVRSTPAGAPRRLVPLIRLIVAESIEHEWICLPANSPSQQTLRILTERVLEEPRNWSESRYRSWRVSDDAVKTIVQYLRSGSTAQWPFEAMTLSVEACRDLAEAGSDASGETARVHDKKRAAGQVSIAPWSCYMVTHYQTDERTKDLCDERASKRPRHASSWHDLCHELWTSTASSGGEETVESQQDSGVSHDSAEIIEKLRSELEAAHATLQAYHYDLSRLQYRYETRLRSHHKVKQGLAQSKKRAEQLQEDVQRLQQRNRDLKEEHEHLRTKIAELTQARCSDSVLEADLLKAKQTVDELTSENAVLKKHAEQAQSRADYTMAQYQKASQAAAQSAASNTQNEQKIALLEKRAAGRAVELQQLRNDNAIELHLARIAQLEAALRNRDRILRAREEELHELKKNRPSTRAISTQPRSVTGLSPGASNTGTNASSTSGSTCGSETKGAGGLAPFG